MGCIYGNFYKEVCPYIKPIFKYARLVFALYLPKLL